VGHIQAIKILKMAQQRVQLLLKHAELSLAEFQAGEASNVLNLVVGNGHI